METTEGDDQMEYEEPASAAKSRELKNNPGESNNPTDYLKLPVVENSTKVSGQTSHYVKTLFCGMFVFELHADINMIADNQLPVHADIIGLSALRDVKNILSANLRETETASVCRSAGTKH